MNKPRYFLITTAEEQTWNYQQPVLCLGEWCKKYDRREQWEKLSAETVPYHWNDRKKLYRDYQYLRGLYETLLDEVTAVLNQVHRTTHSTRYWRTLLGPWLLYFTEMLFDRWETVMTAIAQYEIEYTTVFNTSPADVIPDNMNEFRMMYVTDVWNHVIYGQILEGWTSINCRYIDREQAIVFNPVVPRNTYRQALSGVKNIFVRTMSRVIRKMVRDTDAVLSATYLSFKTELRLQLSLGQAPVFWSQETISSAAADIALRKTIRLPSEGPKGFENCVRALIPLHIPAIYLEGYPALEKKVSGLHWPKKPKVIFTSAAYNSDDVFKAWAASRVEENGSPLVIGQHGGNLGSALWTSSEDHETAISDRYFSWGWTTKDPKHYPIGILKHLQSGAGKWNASGNLLMVTTVMPRYSYVMGSFPVAAGQTEQSLDEQYDFVRMLPENIFQRLRVRLFRPDWEWSQADRWRNRFPDIAFDDLSKSIEQTIAASRLVVVIYNGTVFLETLARNIPTIIFWNPEFNELRESVRPYFELLAGAGIFHRDCRNAAEKINEVWNDVPNWWNDEKVQNARKEFCHYMADVPQQPVAKLKKGLLSINNN